MTGLSRFVIVAVIAGLGACTPMIEQSTTKPPINGKAHVVVDNHNWLDVTVYIVHGATRTRLGTVSSMQTARFAIPDAYVVGVSDVTIQADPIGSQKTFVSGPIQVFPGSKIVLDVANSIQLSSFGVYATR